jgi:hypothetical protein
MDPESPRITVIGPHDRAPPGTLALAVSTPAPVSNPAGWKDLWLLSPFSVVAGGIEVPGLGGVRSMTMENAWQFLKIWPGEDGWNKEEAMAAFGSSCAIRYPRGRGAQAVGHHWGETGERLPYVEARKRIYVPLYRKILSLPDRAPLVLRLREAALRSPIAIWDPDSYDLRKAGLRDELAALEDPRRPFAHAFMVAMAVRGTSLA